MLHLVFREIDRAIGKRPAPLEAVSVRDLPPRLQEVLICLMQGDSEAEAAARLGLSTHTLHEYVRRLHDRFDVSSRGELLAECRDYWPVLRRLQSQLVYYSRITDAD